MNKCGVCGAPCRGRTLNCSLHAYVHDRTLGLAREIYLMDEHILSSKISELAKEFKVSTQTVRNHLKKAGYEPLPRRWGANKK